MKIMLTFEETVRYQVPVDWPDEMPAPTIGLFEGTDEWFDMVDNDPDWMKNGLVGVVDRKLLDVEPIAKPVCEACGGSGFLPNCERCDACDKFASDEEAHLAIYHLAKASKQVDEMSSLLDEIRCRFKVYSDQGDFDVSDLIPKIDSIIAECTGKAVTP